MQRVKLYITVDVPDDYRGETPVSYEEDGIKVAQYEVHFHEIPESKRTTSVKVTTRTPEHPEAQELTLPKQTLEASEGPIKLFMHINRRLEQAQVTRPVTLNL
jgi:hypothetical protein